MNNALPKLAAQIAKKAATRHLEIQGPPAYGDVLHDGLVQSGKTIGSALGGAAGWWGGRALGGPGGGVAGMTALGSLGRHAGGWAGHIAYLQGPVIKDILSHPDNFTVDAAGAIVPRLLPVSSTPDVASEVGTQLGRRQHGSTGMVQVAASPGEEGQSVFDTGASSIPFLRPTNGPGGLPDLLSEVSFIDPHSPAPPAPGGLLGLLQDTFRTNSARP